MVGTILTNNGKVLHNSTTKFYDRFILGASIGSLLTSALGENLGQTALNFPQRVFSASSGFGTEAKNVNNLITIYLLNLSSGEQQALSKNTTKNPILKSDGTIDNSKVVGYAKAYYPVSGEKQGSLNTLSGEIGLNPDKFGISFKWEKGSLNGTFNTIIIGSDVITNSSNCFTIGKKIGFGNVLKGEASTDVFYLTGGVKKANGETITEANEILVGNGTIKDKARKKINIDTFEITDLDSSSPLYDIKLYDKPHLPLKNGAIVYKDGSSVYVYNVESGASIKSISSTKGFAVNSTGLFVKNGTKSNPAFQCYDIETLNRKSESDITPSVPSYITDWGNWELMPYVGEKIILVDSTTFQGYIYTSLNALTVEKAIMVNTGTPIGDCFITTSEYSMRDGATSDKNFSPSNISASIPRKSLVLLDEDGVSQVLAFSKIDEPITIAETEGFSFDYFWNF